MRRRKEIFKNYNNLIMIFSMAENNTSSLVDFLKTQSFRIVKLVLLVLVLFIGAKFVNEVKKYRFIGEELVSYRTVSVTGTGEVFVTPNVAEVMFTVMREAQTASDVQRQSAEAINSVMGFLQGAGIVENDIKTTGYTIYPQYDYNQNGQVFKGYQARQSLEIKLRQIDKIGEILTGVTSAGANEVGGVNFTVDDEASVMREARKLAILDAQKNAKELAEELQVTFGRIINMSYSQPDGIIPLDYNMGKGGFGGGIAPGVPTGENKVGVFVNLTYEIR